MTRYVRAVWLFVRIVWRPWDVGYRLSVRTAWEVARIIHLD